MEKVSVLWKSCWLTKTSGKHFLPRQNFSYRTSRICLCCATSNSAGSVIDPVLVRLQAHLGIEPDMHATMRRSFSYDLYFCHSKADAMLAKFAVNACASCFFETWWNSVGFGLIPFHFFQNVRWPLDRPVLCREKVSAFQPMALRKSMRWKTTCASIGQILRSSNVVPLLCCRQLNTFCQSVCYKYW